MEIHGGIEAVKRFLAITVLCAVFMALTVSVGAQENDDEGAFYARSFLIYRIFPNQRGYRVQYWTDSGAPAETYLPIDWFQRSGGRGVFLEGDNPAYPYMQVLWRDGEFSQIRLYVRENIRHESWGRWIAPDNADELFDVEEPALRL